MTTPQFEAGREEDAQVLEREAASKQLSGRGERAQEYVRLLSNECRAISPSCCLTAALPGSVRGASPLHLPLRGLGELSQCQCPRGVEIHYKIMTKNMIFT